MFGFSFGGCLEFIHFLLVIVLVGVWLSAVAAVALLVVRVLNRTVFDSDERAAGGNRRGRESEWKLLADDVYWRRTFDDGLRRASSAKPQASLDPVDQPVQPFG